MRALVLFLFLFLFLVPTVTVTAQTKSVAPEKFSANVGVEVVPQGPGTAELYSYITRELRTLNDVVIVTDQRAAAYKIVVSMQEIRDDYYAILPMYLKRADCLFPKVGSRGKGFMESCVAFETLNSMSLVKPEMFRELASVIVTTLDTTLLEPDRKRFNK